MSIMMKVQNWIYSVTLDKHMYLTIPNYKHTSRVATEIAGNSKQNQTTYRCLYKEINNYKLMLVDNVTSWSGWLNVC